MSYLLKKIAYPKAWLYQNSLRKIFYFAAIACIFLCVTPNIASAAVCGTAATDTLQEIHDGGGECYITPESYKITIYQMAFCTENPLTGWTKDGYSSAAAVDYNSCSITFNNPSGTPATFSAGSGVNLPEVYSSAPAAAIYPYALIKIGKLFTLKAKFTDGGTTYYSTNNRDENTMNNWTTTASSYVPYTDNLTSFVGSQSCAGTGYETMAEGEMQAGLYDVDGNAILNTEGSGACSGVDSVVGIMVLTSPVEVTEDATGLTATFTVTNLGATLVVDDAFRDGIIDLDTIDGIGFFSGPFSVKFTSN